VYVTDTGNKRVQKVSGEGEVLGIWGQGGVGPGEFEEPIGIGIGERGEVYVADVWNRRVQKFGEGFVYEGEWKVEGGERQTVDNKAYLAVGGGRVYVTDPEWNRVIVFSEGGEVEAVWGSYGGDAGSLYMPTGVAVGMGGRVYVVDSFNHRVVSYAPLRGGTLLPWERGKVLPLNREGPMP
jgi:DNA-binding beta-propeller fold protein YncE